MLPAAVVRGVAAWRAARGDNVRRAHVGLAKEGLQSRAAYAWDSFAGGPAAAPGTQQEGVCGLQPVEHLRARVLQGARETVGEPPLVTAHALAVCNALCQGAPGGALRCEGLQLVAV